jgi:hypothetical protein
MLLVVAANCFAAEGVFGELVNWSAAGLVEPFSWCVQGPNNSPLTRYVEQGVVREGTLKEVLRGRTDEIELLHLIVKTSDQVETMAAANAFDQALRILSTSTTSDAYRRRITLVAPDSLDAPLAPGYDPTWGSRILLLPIESRRPGAFTDDTVKNYSSHAAHGVCSIARLWKGLVDGEANDLSWIQSGGFARHDDDNRHLLVAQTMTRVLEFPNLVPDLLEVTKSDREEFRNPDFRLFALGDLSPAIDNLIKAFTEYSALKPIDLTPVANAPVRRRLVDALRDILQFLRGELSATPRRVLTAKLQSVKTRLQAAVDQLYPGQVTIVWPGEPSTEVGESLEESLKHDLPQVSYEILSGDVGKLWRDFWMLCLGLIDGGPLADPFISLLTTDGQRLLAENRSQIVPVDLASLFAPPPASESQVAVDKSSSAVSGTGETAVTLAATSDSSAQEVHAVSTNEKAEEARPSSIAQGLVSYLQSYIDSISKRLEEEYVAPPLPKSLAPHRGPVGRLVDRIFRRKRNLSTGLAEKVQKRPRSLRRRAAGFLGSLVISGITFLVYGAFWALTALASLGGSLLIGIAFAFVRGLIEEKDSRRYLTGVELSKMNFALRQAKLRAELRRMGRRLEQAEDWMAMIAQLVHHPWRDAPLAFDVQSQSWNHPEGVFVGLAKLDDHGREKMQVQFARQVYSVGWLGSRFQAILDHAVTEREETLFAGRGSIGTPEADDSPERNGLRGQLRRDVVAYFQGTEADPLLLEKISQFITDQGVDSLVSSIDVSGESTGTGSIIESEGLSVSQFFRELSNPDPGTMPPGLWASREEVIIRIDEKVMYGDISTARLAPRASGNQVDQAPPRLVMTRVDMSSRSVTDLVSHGDNWLTIQPTDDDGYGQAPYVLGAYAADASKMDSLEVSATEDSPASDDDLTEAGPQIAQEATSVSNADTQTSTITASQERDPS